VVVVFPVDAVEIPCIDAKEAGAGAAVAGAVDPCCNMERPVGAAVECC